MKLKKKPTFIDNKFVYFILFMNSELSPLMFYKIFIKCQKNPKLMCEIIAWQYLSLKSNILYKE